LSFDFALVAQFDANRVESPLAAESRTFLFPGDHRLDAGTTGPFP